MNVNTLTLYLYVTCTLRDVVTLTFELLNLESCHFMPLMGGQSLYPV